MYFVDFISKKVNILNSKCLFIKVAGRFWFKVYFLATFLNRTGAFFSFHLIAWSLESC